MRRGIGYCENAGCNNGNKMLLGNEVDAFFCESCGQPGKVEMERGFFTGEAGIIREVRVEYNFDPRKRRYRASAIVRDESLPSRCDRYTRLSPVTRCEESALSLAEALFVQLSRCRDPSDESKTSRAASFVLSFDDDIELFRRSLWNLRERWEAAGLLERQR